jgi:hypothetical protein
MKCCFPLLLWFCLGLAYAAPAHVHGEARLEMTLEGGQLAITLDTPLDNLIGFEHAPATETERKAVAAMVDKLNHPDRLFALATTARCASVSIELESSILAEKSGKREDEEEHDDEHDEHHDDEHGDLEAHYLFACKNPDALRELTIHLFSEFPHLQRVQIEFAGPGGQRAAKLNAGNPRFAW